MRHTNFVDVGSTITILNDIDSTIKEIYQIDNTGVATPLTFPLVSAITNHYKISITAPNTSCYLYVVWGEVHEIIRVGDPDIKVFAVLDAPLTYTQYNSIDGTVIDTGTFTNMVGNLYAVSPLQLVPSYYVIDGYGIITLKVPYTVVNFSSASQTSSTITAYQNFIDVGYAEFGFLGDRNSYFDDVSGQWIQDATREATAYDLAKAVAYKYGLVWDRTQTNFIGNYIAYMRTYDEEAKVFRLYVPGITPIDNINNFTLYSTDELGNDYLRGVSMLVTKSLETTADGSSGLIIPYR